MAANADARTGQEPQYCMNFALDYAEELTENMRIEALYDEQTAVLATFEALMDDETRPPEARLEEIAYHLRSREMRDFDRAIRTCPAHPRRGSLDRRGLARAILSGRAPRWRGWAFGARSAAMRWLRLSSTRSASSVAPLSRRASTKPSVNRAPDHPDKRASPAVIATICSSFLRLRTEGRRTPRQAGALHHAAQRAQGSHRRPRGRRLRRG